MKIKLYLISGICFIVGCVLILYPIIGSIESRQKQQEIIAGYEMLNQQADSEAIAYIEIPKIDCRLPILYGTQEEILEYAVGCVPQFSLPGAGIDSHCVLVGHSGFPTAELFSSIEELETEDEFYLYVRDEILTYQVEQIRIIEQDADPELRIEKDMDYCTLVTCTPYGINSHRLLVRGVRIEE